MICAIKALKIARATPALKARPAAGGNRRDEGAQGRWTRQDRAQIARAHDDSNDGQCRGNGSYQARDQDDIAHVTVWLSQFLAERDGLVTAGSGVGGANTGQGHHADGDRGQGTCDASAIGGRTHPRGCEPGAKNRRR